MSAQFNVVVKVDASSAAPASDQAKNALKGVQDEAKKTKSELDKVFELYAIVQLAREVMSLGDVYNGVRNRVALVATSHENLNAVMERTFDIAQQTRQKWDAVAATYQRLQMASQNLGMSQSAMLDFTQLLGQAMQISGVKTKASSMAMMELADAFTVGAMSGRKFRTFMQDAGATIPLLAKSLHMTAGEFVELGLKGHVTAQMLRDGFVGAKQDIEDAFGKMTPTIGQSLTMLENAAAHFFGTMSTSSGALGVLASVIQFVAKNFDTFGRILMVVAEVVGVALAVKAIGKLIEMMSALRAAAIANPWMELLLVFTGLVAVLQNFGDKITIADKGSDGLGKTVVKVSSVLHVLWDDIKAGASAIGDFVANGWDKLVHAFDDGIDGSGIDLSLRNVLRVLAAFAGAVRGIFNFIRNDLEEIFGGLAALVAKHFEGVINAVIAVFNKVSDAIAVIQNPTQAATGIMGTMKAFASFGSAKTVDDAQKAVDAGKAAMANAPKGTHLEAIDLSGVTGADVSRKVGEAKAHIAADVQDTITSMDHYVDGVLKRASAYQNGEKDGTLDTTDAPYSPYNVITGKKDPFPAQLAAVLKNESPITKANETIMHAISILDEGVRRGMVTQEKASEVVAEYIHRLYDQLHPVQAMNDLLTSQNAALKENAAAREHANKLEEVERQLKAKGMTQQQWDGTPGWVAFDSQGNMNSIDPVKGQREEFDKILADREAIERMNKIEETHQELINSKVKERAKVEDAALERNRKLIQEMDITDMTDKTLKALVDHIADVGSQMKTTILGVYDGLNDMLLEFIDNQTVSWKKFVDSTLDNIAKLAIKSLEVQGLQAIGVLPSAAAVVRSAEKPLTDASLGLDPTQGTRAALSAAGTSVAGGITEAGGDVVAALAALATALGGVGTASTSFGSFGAAAAAGASQGFPTPDPVDTVTSAARRGPQSTRPGAGSSTGGQSLHVHIHDNPKDLLAAAQGVEGDRIVFEAYRRNPIAAKRLLGR